MQQPSPWAVPTTEDSLNTTDGAAGGQGSAKEREFAGLHAYQGTGNIAIIDTR